MSKTKKKKSSKKKVVKDPEELKRDERKQELMKKAQFFTEDTIKQTQATAELENKLQQVQDFWDVAKQDFIRKSNDLVKLQEEVDQSCSKHSSKIEKTREEIKNQLYRQQHELTEQKNGIQIIIRGIHSENSKLVELKSKGILQIKNSARYTQLSQQEFLNQLKQTHSNEIISKNHHFIENFYKVYRESEQNLKEIREEFESKGKDIISRLEVERTKESIRIEEHYDQMLSKLRSEYNTKLHGELDTIQKLKQDLTRRKKELRKLEKDVNEIERKNMDICQPYDKAQQDIKRLHREQEEYNTELITLEEKKAELKAKEKTLKDLKWRHEIVLQKFELLSDDCDVLRKNVESKRLQKFQLAKRSEMEIKELVTSLEALGRNHINKLLPLVSKEDVSKDILSNLTLEKVQALMQELHENALKQLGLSI